MKEDLPVIAGAGVFDSRIRFPDKTLTSLRTVTEYEIELFRMDGGTCYINGNQYNIRKGNVLIAKPGDKRRSALHFMCHFIHFTTNNAQIIKLLSSMPEFLESGEYFEFNPYFCDVYAALVSDDIYAPVFSTGRLYELIYNLYKKSRFYIPSDKISETPVSAISQAFAYINEHYSEQISVQSVANYCNVSQSYLYKLFERIAQTTPNEYLANIRVSAAKSALLSSNAPLWEIAAACGFVSQSYFCYVFKKAAGISPGKFRKAFKYPDLN